MIVRMVLKSLFSKPVRSFLTILSIIIGVMSVIIIESVSSTGTAVISNELSSLGIDCISITSRDSEQFTLNNDDINIINRINGVKEVYGFFSQNGMIKVDNKTNNIIFWGLNDSENHLLSIEMKYGEFLSQNDIGGAKNVCVIGIETAEEFFGSDPKNAIGRKISAVFKDATLELEVIGIAGKSSGIINQVINEFVPQIVYLPSSCLQSAVNSNSLSQISVTMHDMSENNVNQGILEIKRALSESHESNQVSIENLTENKNSIIKILSLVKGLLTAIAGISVIVACIGITNIMFISVNERKREIGIKKAIGASKLQIGTEFFLEGILISLGGCLLGIFFSFVLINVVNLYFPNFNLEISKQTASLAISISIILGSVFSIVPSLKAACKRPVACLKIE